MTQVSIIIPTYNRVAWLPQAIESAKSAGNDVEVIVVDNGSTDETPKVCRDTPGIRYIRVYPNVRQAHARNAGIEISNGEFLVFLDDDDRRLADSLEAQIKLLESKPELGFVYGRVLLGDSLNCEPTGETSPAQCLAGDLFWTLLEGNFIHFHSVVTRRKFVEEIGRFDPEVVGAEDWMMLIRLSERRPIGVIEPPVAIYRTFTPVSGQTSSRRAWMCAAAARAQAKALRLPRALEAPDTKRKAVRRRFLNTLSGMLIDETMSALTNHNYRLAIEGYLTALKLNTIRAAHPYTLKTLLLLALTGKNS